MTVITIPGCSFEGLRSVRPRTEPPRAVVLHWTGGPDRGPGATRDAQGVFHTLRSTVGRRTPDGISVHYVTEAEGITVRMAPEELVCLHAGDVNDWTIGWEVISPGYPGTAAEGAERKRGVVRRSYMDRIRSRRVSMLDYTDAQYDALFPILEDILARWNIPRLVPMADGDLLQRQMSDAELATFRGVMGHFHCHHEKNDPGTMPFRRLMERWGL